MCVSSGFFRYFFCFLVLSLVAVEASSYLNSQTTSCLNSDLEFINLQLNVDCALPKRLLISAVELPSRSIWNSKYEIQLTYSNSLSPVVIGCRSSTALTRITLILALILWLTLNPDLAAS